MKSPIDMDYPTSLKTERLELRPLERKDVPDILSIFSHPEVTRYYEIETLSNFSQAEILLDHFIAMGRVGISLKGETGIIGSCGLFSFSMEYFSASLGYDLSPEHWGKGIMTEALGALLRHAFFSMNLNRINALTYPDNALSIRVLSELGFRAEGVMREFGFWKGSFHDMTLHSLLKREFQSSSVSSCE